jgi:hypothetical protein
MKTLIVTVGSNLYQPLSAARGQTIIAGWASRQTQLRAFTAGTGPRRVQFLRDMAITATLARAVAAMKRYEQLAE